MDTTVLTYIKNLWNDVRAAKRSSGKSPIRQFQEFVTLSRRTDSGRLGISDYYKYQLFLEPPVGPGAKEDFAGWRMVNWLDNRLNDSRWQVLTRDKISMYSLLSACKVAIPELFAVYEERNRLVPGVKTVCTPDALGDLLRGNIQYPFFSKPAYGDIGRGALSAHGYDSRNDSLILGNGELLGVDRFIAGLSRQQSWMEPEHGFIFQEFVQQHPLLANVSAHVSTARVVVLYSDKSATPFRAVWRIVTGTNMTDNFDSGKSGNLLAELDLKTGRVERVVQGVGFDRREIREHPDSKVPLVGFQLPYWERVLEVVCRAARIFPMMRFQHWDIAFGEQQPVVLEVNVGGSLDVHQVGSGKGIYDPTLREFIRRYGQDH